MKKIVPVFVATLFAFVVLSCASNPTSKKAVLTQGPERMFWRITGTDAKGLPSTVYIQGTIHVGDDQLYPLADSVNKAFDSATRIAGEISTEGYASLEKETQKRLIQSYLDASGRNVLDALSEEQKQALYSVLDKNVADQIALFEPWALNTTASAYTYFKSGLSTDKAIDVYFINRAAGRTMLGLDTLDTQFKAMQFGTYDEQLVMLKDTLDTIANPTDLNTMTDELYKAYLAGDVQKVSKIMYESDEKDIKKNELYKRYNEVLITNRNISWADTIKGWLSEGGTTFIFAGCAHFVGDNSVFVYLKKNGTL